MLYVNADFSYALIRNVMYICSLIYDNSDSLRLISASSVENDMIFHYYMLYVFYIYLKKNSTYTEDHCMYDEYG